MYRLIFSDMDGTLLDESMSVNPKTAEAINSATQNDMEFVIATGRQLKEAAPLVEKYGIHPAFITLNGAQIFDEDKKLIGENPLTFQQVDTIRQILKEYGLYHELITAEAGVVSENKAKRYQNMISWLSRLKPSLSPQELKAEANRHPELLNISYVDNLNELINAKETTPLKMGAVSEPDDNIDLQIVKDEIEKNVPDILITSSASDNLEINHINATKGNAISQFSKSRNVPMSQTIAFGDNLNDESMINAAGLGVAMGNSHPHIKKIANDITLTNRENGVGNYINNLLN